jgi:hypothetical protein
MFYTVSIFSWVIFETSVEHVESECSISNYQNMPSYNSVALKSF